MTVTAMLSRVDVIKGKIHKRILSLVDLRTMESMTSDQLRNELKMLTERLLKDDNTAINEAERRTIVQSIQNEMLQYNAITEVRSNDSKWLKTWLGKITKQLLLNI